MVGCEGISAGGLAAVKASSGASPTSIAINGHVGRTVTVPHATILRHGDDPLLCTARHALYRSPSQYDCGFSRLRVMCWRAGRALYGDAVSMPLLLAFARRKLGAPRRASTYFWLIVVVLSATGTLYLWKGADTVEVYTASVDLPVFHQLREGDLQSIRIPAFGRHPDVMSTSTKIVGRYTLVKIGKGAPLLGNRLGPALPRGELDGFQIASLPVAVSDLANGAISRGDRVDVILSSTATDGTPRSGVLRRVLVLDVQAVGTDSANAVLVVALSPADQSTLMSTGGTARIFVLLAVPYVAP